MAQGGRVILLPMQDSHGLKQWKWWLDSHGTFCLSDVFLSGGWIAMDLNNGSGGWTAMRLVRLRCCVLSQCCQDSLRVHLRKAYHKYVEEKQGKGMASAFDTFLEEMIDYMDNQVQEEDEAMEAGPRGYLVWAPEEDSEEESKEAEKVAEELMPNVPEYKDGGLDPSFWQEHWNLFKQCGECKEYTYVNKNHMLRAQGCRGCMKADCKGNRKNGKKNLLKVLAKYHGESWVMKYCK